MFPTISNVPTKPGVYIFKNAREKVLYVGKAKNLKSRLKSYFQRKLKPDFRRATMMKEVEDYSFIVTDNELEAFVLEANLIKQYKPRFNVILRDDKNYPYIKLTTNEEWPRLEVVRKIKKDGAVYFGPYVPAGTMWETLTFIRRNFPIRDCRFSIDKPMRPCIQYQMGRCLAPCAAKISREEYMRLVEEIRLFLSGEKKYLLNELKEKMMMLSEQMRFEEAARIRDRITALERAWESQKVIASELGDSDIIGFYRHNGDASLEVFFVRNGIMIGSKDFYIKDSQMVSDSELINAFLAQFYAKEIVPPKEIITSAYPNDYIYLTKWLSRLKGEEVKIKVPKSGKRKELVQMAVKNSYHAYERKKEMKTEEILSNIQERFKLEEIPQDIGAFDVSTISGDESVGAFVYWSKGDFKKEKYRRLQIKTVQSIDDYSMTEEIIERIIGNLEGDLPNLIIIDGGRGHLETAKRVIEKNYKILKKSPALIAIAKKPDRGYSALFDQTINLEDKKPSSLLLKRIRDEAHRFAIGYHRKLRVKEMLKSPLERIPGIGKKRRLDLLRVFGSIENIRNAGIDEIVKLKGFNKKIAETLLEEIRRIS